MASVVVATWAVAGPAGAGGDAWEFPDRQGVEPRFAQGEHLVAVAYLGVWSADAEWDHPVDQPLLAYLVPIDDYTWYEPQALVETGYLVGTVTAVDAGWVHDGSVYGRVHLWAEVEIPEIPVGDYWLANCDLTCTHDIGVFTGALVIVTDGAGRAPDVVAGDVSSRADGIEQARLDAIERGVPEELRHIPSYLALDSPVYITPEQRGTPKPLTAPDELDEHGRAVLELVAPELAVDDAPAAPARTPAPEPESGSIPGVAVPSLLAVAGAATWMLRRRRRVDGPGSRTPDTESERAEERVVVARR